MSKNTELNWNFQDPRTNQIYPLGVKGSVQEGLISNKLMPDPFDQLNENLFGWVEDYKWTCTSELQLTAVDLNHKFIKLEFPSIDTYADVYVNDSLVLTTNNAFKSFSVDIKNVAKVGNNSIKVIFTPPVIFHRAEYDTMPYHLPAINDVSPIAIASMVRKPQYQFGWDWALRMVTMGFNKPAVIHVYNVNRLVQTNVQTKNISDNSAELDFSMHFDQNLVANSTYYWSSQLNGKRELTSDGSKILTFPIEVNNPKLWYPKGHGDPNLYEDKWTLSDKNGNILAQQDVVYGIRTADLVQNEDQWGTSFEIWVNKKPIFCKGGDYIPQDIFLARISTEERLRMVEMMDQANFNMVRVWGGGMYADDDFLAACDKKGIMVWHDMMFACSVYPGDSAYLKNVEEEFDYQIPRISSHASLVLFNGNNEVDVAWKNWGFQLRYGIHGKDAKAVEENYDKLFKVLAPNTIAKYSNIPYVHTSPLSNWTEKEMFDHGTQHYWGVWHGKDDIEEFSRKIGRFNAEYGFQSFPEFSTLRTFSYPEQWNLDSAVMKHHQKSYVGNGMIEKHAKRLYGKMQNFETFVYYSQLTQAKAVSIAVAGHRVDAPRCMGTLFWQLNDCWPAPSWSSIDYYNNWKALQYEMRKDFKNVTMVQRINKLEEEEYFFVSDLNDTVQSKIKMTAYNFKGKIKETKEIDVKMIGLGSLSIIKAEKIDDHKDNLVVNFEWQDENGILCSRQFVHEPDNYHEADQKDFTVEIIENDSLNKRIAIKINTDKFLNDFWLSSKISGLTFSENFIPVLPGEKIIYVQYENLPLISDFTWMWR